MGDERVRFDAFFKAFYIEGKDGCLIGCTTTSSIPKFFVEKILPPEEIEEHLPTDDSSYDKWYQGNSSPRNHWNRLRKYYDEDALSSALDEAIDNQNIEILLSNFNIQDHEKINKELLCVAIAQQFKVIIEGKGEGPNVVSDIYTAGNIKADFSRYVNKAVKRYRVMKLVGGDEVLLNNFFVCNTIGEKERVFADKKRISCEYIDKPSLESIRNVYSDRNGYDNLKTVLFGSGGCGKSLMLQHLFLQAANEYKKSGVLPVFLELRYFIQSDTITSFIVKTVKSKDNSFNEDSAHKLMLSGRVQLLMDGFDEIDPSDVNHFLLELEKFVDTYEKVQIVLSSRENDCLRGLREFTKWYVWPFDREQSELLVDKILIHQNQQSAKEKVMKYICDGFLKKDGVFASHPLLLTFVAMHFPEFNRYNKDHKLFYKITYEALLSDHDDNKKPYDRVFTSVDDAVQFSTVFKEFCAITYRDAMLQFNSTQFETYFGMLKSHLSFTNPSKMNLKSFKHDVCSTACMMYEKEYDMYYIDPGFQEFLFAEYYAQVDEREMPELLGALKKVSFAKLGRLDALDMLRNSADLKFKKCILLPFLNGLFKGSDEESFLSFLVYCFNSFDVLNYDIVRINDYEQVIGASGHKKVSIGNETCNVLMSYVLKSVGIDPDYAFIFQADCISESFPNTKETGYLIGKSSQVDEVPCIEIECMQMQVINVKNKQFESGVGDGAYILNRNCCLDILGKKITIDCYDLDLTPDDYRPLVKNIIDNSTDTIEVLMRVKAYYKELKKELFRSNER